MEEKNDQRQLQAVLRAAPVAILSFDQEGRVLTWNPAAEQIFGWSEAEVLGKLPLHLGAQHEEFERLRQRVQAGETIAGIEVRRRRRDGTAVDLELSGAPLRDVNGNIIGKMAVLVDITDRKRVEETAVRSRDFYKALFNDFPTLIWQAGTDAKCCYFNRTWLEFTGRTLEQEMGDGWTQGLHPDDLEKTVKSYLEAFHARQPFEIEYRMRCHDGEYRDIVDFGRPFSGLHGHFEGYTGPCYDITERKKVENALQRARNAFGAISNSGWLAWRSRLSTKAASRTITASAKSSGTNGTSFCA
jgi:two-component system NtrC family sensor kinase